ncbi:hypothetical protein GLYMA_18G270500v4 [Glycine max]|uniref:phosphopyruvate hydratase n=1 Tax=Glycine max TaxID=3847 RepID=K7MV03_SOYBN|nr:60 kDa chaperonin [Glycine max]KAH1156356.1 hypothetical protein GYH30_051247 [Glycine max]KRH01342.1 hypothetical protein GLYMA_18G270500v4 [Glycine max]
MIVPIGASKFEEALRMGTETYHHLKVEADIVKRALSYPLKLIAKNARVNDSVVSEKVLSSDNPGYGYNAATGKYEDLMSAGIIDPTKVRATVAELQNVVRVFSQLCAASNLHIHGFHQKNVGYCNSIIILASISAPPAHKGHFRFMLNYLHFLFNIYIHR